MPKADESVVIQGMGIMNKTENEGLTGGMDWGKEYNNVKDTFEFKLERLSLDITETIIEQMNRKQVTRKELAERLGVSKAAVSSLLNQGSNITIKRLVAISEALESDVSVGITPRKTDKTQVEETIESGRLDYDPKRSNVISLEKAKKLYRLADDSCNAVSKGQPIHAYAY